MTITILTEDMQSRVKTYNKDKTKFEVIPLTVRNANTAWPLLQVSLFSISMKDPEKYVHALGGGKCHNINIGAFNLACLLTKIPGTMAVSTEFYGRKTVGDADKLRVENIEKFLSGYEIKHKHAGITISSYSSGYGPLVKIVVPEGNSATLSNAISDIFKFAFRANAPLIEIGRWDDVSYTLSVIQQEINADTAIFSNGQVFIDLGSFLENAVNDPKLTAYFKQLFKVEELFSLLKTVTPPEVATPLKTNPQIEALKSAIEKMSRYGAKLLETSADKSSASIALAFDLENKLAFFFESAKGRPLTKGAYDQFVKEFESILHRHDALFTSKASYYVIINNISIALADMSSLFKEGKYSSSALTMGIFSNVRVDDALYEKASSMDLAVSI